MNPFLLVAAMAMALFCVAGCKPTPPGAGPAGGGRPGGGSAVQVIAIPVLERPVIESIPLVGSIAANEAIEVRSETDGLISLLPFEEGQRVAKDDLLVALDDSKLAAALQEAEANQKLAEANFARARQLAADKLISGQEYDQTAALFTVNQATVELRRRQLRDTRIHAPFSGTVGTRLVSPGQVISRSTLITSLVDLDSVKVEMNVPERYLSQIRTGQSIRFRVDAHPSDTFTGEVFFIAPQLDPATRTALVKALVPNPDGKLRAGMFAKLDLTVQLRDKALVIPEAALISNGQILSVFIVTPQTNALLRTVEVGIRLSGRAEIVSGLTHGETVIVEGLQKLFPGAPVRLAPPEAAAPYLD
jgi:membrane fusion protein (multidrug efflux system)